MGSNRVCEVEQAGESIHAYFTHADHIGSSNILTDESGQRVSLFEYEPFGSIAYAAEDNTYDTDKRFTGKTYDTSSGLHYYGARYYDSELGRFITADPTIQHPYDPQDFNRYAYARNNPVKYVDPTGYGFWSWLKSFFSAFVGAVAAVVLAPVVGPIFSGMIGGAIAGGIAGAFEGGLGGALRGAAFGAAIGGIMGGAFSGLEQIGQGFGYGFLGAAMAGGAVYAGIAGGGEGLANYIAGTLGGLYGASFGIALASEPLLGGDLEPLDSGQIGLGDGETVIDAQYALDVNYNISVSPESPDDIGIVEIYTRDVYKPWGVRLTDAHPYAKSTWDGKYHELSTIDKNNRTLINIISKVDANRLTSLTQSKIAAHPQPNYRVTVSKAKFYRAIESYKNTNKDYSAGRHIRNCRGFMDYIMNESVIR